MFSSTFPYTSSSQRLCPPDLTSYKDAVWDFLLEHSDITHGGALFAKFHTSHRADFERRIKARQKGYHRKDPKTKECVKEAGSRR
jgi:hypothetical protein